MAGTTLPRRLVLTSGSALVLAGPLVASAASAAPASSGPVTWRVRVGAETPDMAVTAMRYLPGEVWVNVGDTVSWRTNSAEPHTVTFLAPGTTTLPDFNPFDPTQVFQQGPLVYDGTQYLNSGIIASQPIFVFSPVGEYHLTFTAVGDHTYYCLLHGEMMSGTVHVRPQGTAYPYTQNDYDRAGNAEAQETLSAGRTAWRTELQSHATTGPQVLVGVDGLGFGVSRFVRDHVVVHVGDTVSFSVAGPGAPHTVTFGQEPPGLAIFAPSGDPTHYAGGDLNSGLMEPGAPFDVTFTAVGTFPYICAIHDDMGMVGEVVVED